MVVVRLGAIPVTIPVVPMVATVGALELHVPAPAGSFSIIVWPTHTLAGPEIGETGFTNMAAELIHPVGIV
jgi:hypothetical protein